MKALLGTVLVGLMAVAMTGAALAGPTAVGLGTAQDFAVLAGSTVTNTGPTTITGNVGVDPGTAVAGFGTVTLSGSLHLHDAVALQAKNDLQTAYTQAAGRQPVTTIATELGGAKLVAGVYTAASGTFGLTGTLQLDAQNDPNAVFVFQAPSTLITGSDSSVMLINGASACNVFWQVGSSATLAVRTHFKGNILAQESIGLLTGATLEGRALALVSAVTLDSNVVTLPTCTPPSPSPTPSPSATAAGRVLGTGPVVIRVNPSSAPEAGGTVVTISGRGFLGATQVTFGLTPGTHLQVINDHTLRITSPAGQGMVDVVVHTPGRTSPPNSADRFSYFRTGRLPVTGANVLALSLLGLGLLGGGFMLARRRVSRGTS